MIRTIDLLIRKPRFFLNKYRWHAFSLLTIFLLLFYMPCRMQDELSPDAELYIGLAMNINDGTGYFDTIRKEEIMPPVCHPLLLAASFRLGITPFYFTMSLYYLSTFILALGIFRYTGNALFSAVFLLLLKPLLLAEWTPGSAESSLYFSLSLLVAAFTCWRKFGQTMKWTVFADSSIGVGLLVHPILLPVLILFLLGITGIALYRIARDRKFPSSYVTGRWLIVVVIALSFYRVVWLCSWFKYGDSRLASGTYGPIPLYCANNPYLAPGTFYNSFSWRKLSKETHEEIDRIFSNDNGWQKRAHNINSAIIEYFLDQPVRFIKEWYLRLIRYMGFFSLARPVYSILSLLLIPLCAYRLYYEIFVRDRRRMEVLLFPGYIFAFLYYTMAVIISFFVYIRGFRYFI